MYLRIPSVRYILEHLTDKHKCSITSWTRRSLLAAENECAFVPNDGKPSLFLPSFTGTYRLWQARRTQNTRSRDSSGENGDLDLDIATEMRQGARHIPSKGQLDVKGKGEAYPRKVSASLISLRCAPLKSPGRKTIVSAYPRRAKASSVRPFDLNRSESEEGRAGAAFAYLRYGKGDEGLAAPDYSSYYSRRSRQSLRDTRHGRTERYTTLCLCVGSSVFAAWQAFTTYLRW